MASPTSAIARCCAAGGFERERRQQPAGELVVRLVGDPLLLGLHAMLAEGDPQLQREQLIELQPFAGSRERPIVVGEMDVANRAVVADDRSRPLQRAGHRIVERGQLFERAVDQLADRPGGDALRRLVHRRDPAGMHQVGVVAPQELHLLVRELETAPVQRGQARDRHLLALLVLRGQPRLIEEREVEVAGAVADRDRHHRLTVAGLAFRHLAHARDHRHEPADLQLADRLHAGTVDVATRVVVQQPSHGGDVEGAREHLVGLRGLDALPPATGRPGGQPGIDLRDRGLEGQRHRGFLIRRRFYHGRDARPPVRLRVRRDRAGLQRMHVVERR